MASRLYDEEEEAVRAEIGECTEAPDHVEVHGGCVYCGAYLGGDEEIEVT